MKVLVADKLHAAGVTALEAAGHTVVLSPSTTAEALPAALAEHDADVVIVRSTKVSAEAIAAGKRLKLVVRAGAGYDTIDVAAASAAGVFVANCPGRNAVAVAELAFAHILNCDRRLADQTAELRAGHWNKKTYAQARGLKGAVLGVIGAGRIGRAVIQRAQAFEMDVIVWDIAVDAAAAEAMGCRHAATKLELARAADIVTVHVASNPATKGLIDDAFVDALKPGSYIVNTSRGAVADEDALIGGVKEKGLRLGLDVYRDEPGSGVAEFSPEVAQLPGVSCTHHIGASTDEAQIATALEAVRVIEGFAAGGDVPNVLNRARRSAATCILTVRHKNHAGVLARLFDELSSARINVEEMSNVMYEGGAAACARIQLSEEPDAASLLRMRESSDDIIELELSPLEVVSA